MSKKKKEKEPDFIEFSMYSVSANKIELIKELRDIAKKLEHTILPQLADTKQSWLKESWCKLNYGCKIINIKPIRIKKTMEACLKLFENKC